MADNYLESHYEEYLKRKAALASKKSSKKIKRIPASNVSEKEENNVANSRVAPSAAQTD
jgi:hypothetical protein